MIYHDTTNPLEGFDPIRTLQVSLDLVQVILKRDAEERRFFLDLMRLTRAKHAAAWEEVRLTGERMEALEARMKLAEERLASLEPWSFRPAGDGEPGEGPV